MRDCEIPDYTYGRLSVVNGVIDYSVGQYAATEIWDAVYEFIRSKVLADARKFESNK